MTITDITIIAVITLLISGAVWKIVRDKRKGAGCSGCSGCPMSGQCEVPIDKRA